MSVNRVAQHLLWEYFDKKSVDLMAQSIHGHNTPITKKPTPLTLCHILQLDTRLSINCSMFRADMYSFMEHE